MSTDVQQAPEVAASNGGDPQAVDSPSYNKDAWLNGATDLEEGDLFVEELDTWLRIRGLSAGQQARIQDKCLSMKGDTAKVDSEQMAVLKFSEGIVEPKFTVQDANTISRRFGRTFSLVIGAIDELSKASEEDVKRAMGRFRPRR